MRRLLRREATSRICRIMTARIVATGRLRRVKQVMAPISPRRYMRRADDIISACRRDFTAAFRSAMPKSSRSWRRRNNDAERVQRDHRNVPPCGTRHSSSHEGPADALISTADLFALRQGVLRAANRQRASYLRKKRQLILAAKYTPPEVE